MKASFNRKELAEALAKVAPLSPTRTPKPILQNVKLVVEGDDAKLSATNLEQYITVTIGCRPEQGGACLLRTDRIRAIVGGCSDDEVSIETNAKGVLVKGERAKWDLPTENPDEFPGHVKVEGEPVSIECAILRAAIRRSAYCADPGSSRYALGGMFLESTGDELAFVGTDGNRMAAMRVPMNAAKFSGILPLPATGGLSKALPQDGTCELLMDSNALQVSCDGLLFYSRLIDGRFPRWRDALTEFTSGQTFEVYGPSLAEAISQVAVVTTDESSGVLFKFSNGTMRLSAESADKGQSEAEYPIAYELEPTEITLRHFYVTEYLRIAGDQNVTVQINESNAVFGNGRSDYVVMCMAKG